MTWVSWQKIIRQWLEKFINKPERESSLTRKCHFRSSPHFRLGSMDLYWWLGFLTEDGFILLKYIRDSDRFK